jgi:hypothetical protein
MGRPTRGALILTFGRLAGKSPVPEAASFLGRLGNVGCVLEAMSGGGSTLAGWMRGFC